MLNIRKKVILWFLKKNYIINQKTACSHYKELPFTLFPFIFIDKKQQFGG